MVMKRVMTGERNKTSHRFSALLRLTQHTPPLHPQIIPVLTSSCRDKLRLAKVEAPSTMSFASIHAHSILKHEAEKIVHFMMDAGANVDALNEDGQSALMLAAKATITEVVTVLIGNGADVNLRDKNGSTPLLVVTKRLCRPTAKQPLNTGGGQKDESNNSDCDDGDVLSMVRLLVTIGAKKNLSDKKGFTPLHVCAKRGHVGGMQLLLKHGADVNCRTLSGDTPLGLAALAGFLDVVNELLIRDYGADINQANDLGRTPLHLAIVDPKGDFEIASMTRLLLVQTLLKHGSDFNANEGWIEGANVHGTPLMWAAAALNNVEQASTEQAWLVDALEFASDLRKFITGALRKDSTYARYDFCLIIHKRACCFTYILSYTHTLGTRTCSSETF